MFSRIQTVEIQHKHSIHGFLQSKHEVSVATNLSPFTTADRFVPGLVRQAGSDPKKSWPGARRRRRRAAGELSRGRARAPPPSPPQRCLLSHITWMERSPSSSSIVTGTTTNPTTEGREKEWQAGIEASRAPSASTFFPCTHSRTGETASEASGRTEGWLAVLSPFLARKRSRHSIRTAGDQKRWWRKQRKTSSRKLFSGQKKEESSLHSSSEPTPAQVVGKEEDLPSLSLQRLHQCTTHSISKAAVDEIGARLPRIERRRRKISGFSCCSSGAPVFVRETPSFLGS